MALRQASVNSFILIQPLQGVKAIANHRVYLVDSSQVMSYSQFMTRAMVSMAQNIYSM